MIFKIFSHYYPSAMPDITPLVTGLWGGLKDPGEGIWLEYHGARGRFGAVVNYHWIQKHFNIFTTVLVIQVQITEYMPSIWHYARCWVRTVKLSRLHPYCLRK